MEERIWSQIEVRGPDECWPWTGTKFSTGYGLVHINRVPHAVHRIVYKLAVGPIPEGLQIDHTCHNRSECEGGPTCPHRGCENPAHLKPKTPEENLLASSQTQASKNRAKSHCKRGHPFDEENTYIHRGHRACRECSRAAWRQAHPATGTKRGPPRKSHCKWGHALSGSNIYISPDGRRHCRACRMERSRSQRRS